MYDKISRIMNTQYGCSDVDPDLVESYLREGDEPFLSYREQAIIDHLVEQYI